ncbi:MAG: CoA transferase [Acidimicrobiia bacterium]|nr:CoA transferase [Acidimicrobiia bacterium]MDH5288762.1 CoA transferase [Acidimicrobiia bacterium]
MDAIAAELDRIWSLVPGHGIRPPLALAPSPFSLASAFPVDVIATASVAAATLAAAALGRAEAGVAVPLDGGAALASFTGWLRRDGEPIPVWADLSGLYRCRGGRAVQLHANFPHHAAGVAARLGVPEEREAVAAAISRWDAFELERALIADGMIGAAYRTLGEWAAHPHAAATAELPLIEVARLGDAAPLAPAATEQAADDDRALAGVRVVDCTRVLAGPVCGQTLAAHGADVLRVGAPHLPFIPMGVMTTGFGKRNAFVDLDSAEGRGTFAALAGDAHVLVDAYRPGSLAARGFGADELAERRPGIVVVEICAFDWVGPWAGRRGYDSIVQTTTGLAMAGVDAARAGGVDVPDGQPVHLPVQALDYATGFLAAFAAQRLLAHQRREGGSWRARLSLLRTRNWLASLGGPSPFTPAPLPDLSPWLQTVDGPFGRIEAVRPVAGRWDTPPAPLGSSPATWLH